MLVINLAMFCIYWKLVAQYSEMSGDVYIILENSFPEMSRVAEIIQVATLMLLKLYWLRIVGILMSQSAMCQTLIPDLLKDT